MFSWWFNWWRGQSKLRILTLISEVQYDQGRYTLNFDVFKENDSENLRTRRKQEQYVELPCISGACSGLIEIPLVAKRCHIEFTVSGALKPSSELQSGEDTLEYRDTLSENRRILHLTPTNDDKSNGMAFIKFWVDGKVKHTVTLYDVPTTRMEPSLLFAHGSEECSFRSLQTNEASSFREQKQTTDLDLPDKECMAVPDSPRSGPKPVPPEPSTDDDDDDDSVGIGAGSAAAENDQVDGSAGNSRAYAKILSDASLQCLAGFLTPHDGNKLSILLKIPNSVIAHIKKDHSGDSVGITFHCLLHWRGAGGSGGNQATDRRLYEDLINQLEGIGRRDIKHAIQRAFDAKRELDKQDLKHH